MLKIPIGKFYLLAALSLIFFLAGCGKPSEEELWKELMQAHSDQNIDSTIQVCNTILKGYPNGRLAPPALYMLAESYREGKKDYAKAVELYKEFVQKYPSLNQTPVAMFLIGFIYNNNLNMRDSARVAYRAFVEKYPHHDLTSSAEFELQTLGKSPDEVLKEQMEHGAKGAIASAHKSMKKKKFPKTPSGKP
ncbi:MAG: tetratricopeptide repeat protein [Bacteroidota bacterium]|nr:tetratricopeptide repeat protein [Bacteroidota bacterium]